MTAALLIIGAGLVAAGAGARWGWEVAAMLVGALLLAAGVDTARDVLPEPDDEPEPEPVERGSDVERGGYRGGPPRRRIRRPRGAGLVVSEPGTGVRAGPGPDE